MAARILICSASVGSGHGRAAAAIQSALVRLRPDAVVRHIDVLSLANPLFRRIYSKGYFDAIAMSPHLVRFVYDLTDRPAALGRLGADAMTGTLTRMNLRRFVDLLTDEHWDVIVNTHFLPPEIVAHLRQQGRISCPQIIVTTDFDVHRIWVHTPCEHYFTATDESRINLSGYGVPLERISAAGIPVDPVFSEQRSVAECRAKFGISDDRPVVLQLSGGQGFGPAEQVHRRILDVQIPLHVVTIAGRNDAVRQKLASVPLPDRHRRTVIGFTDEIDQYMAAADLIVSKPGGLTVSESLARGAAMIVIEPIPGQEERNCDYLLERGVACKANNLASLSYKITDLVSHPNKLAAMRAASRQAGRPQAAFDVARYVLGIVDRIA